MYTWVWCACRWYDEKWQRSGAAMLNNLKQAAKKRGVMAAKLATSAIISVANEAS